MKALPMFKGWTVDVRLKQFRKVDDKEGLIFLDFITEGGDELLAEYIDQLDLKTQEDEELLQEIWS